MSEERIAGQIIAIELDRLMEISESHAKQRAMESLAGRVKHQFPDCAMCKNLELHEDMDHMRYRRKYAVTCKNRPAYPGSTMTCPDGLVGRIDEKEKKFMAVATPKLTWPTELDEYLTNPVKPGDFFKEYMTDPSIAALHEDVMKRVMEEKAKVEGARMEEMMRRITIRDDGFGDGISKISVGLSKFGPGSSTGYTRADARLNPQIPTDRTSFPPVKPVNKDVPATADGDAW